MCPVGVSSSAPVSMGTALSGTRANVLHCAADGYRCPPSSLRQIVFIWTGPHGVLAGRFRGNPVSAVGRTSDGAVRLLPISQAMNHSLRKVECLLPPMPGRRARQGGIVPSGQTEERAVFLLFMCPGLIVQTFQATTISLRP